jgi:hypothetical protein
MIALHPQLLAKRLRAAERERERYRANVGRERARKRNKYHADEKTRRALKCKTLCRLYGVTLAQYEQMLHSQGGVCAICGGGQEGKSLSVDHCHATGQVRGLCCDPCNRALGLLRDDPERMRKAAEYLEANGSHLVGILKEVPNGSQRSRVARNPRGTGRSQPRRAAG